MSFKDVLVQLSSYPERTPAATLEQAVRIAEALGARLSALAFKIEIPNVGNVLANTLLDVSGMVAVERQKSAANVKLLISEIREPDSEARGGMRKHCRILHELAVGGPRDRTCQAARYRHHPDQ